MGYNLLENWHHFQKKKATARPCWHRGRPTLGPVVRRVTRIVNQQGKERFVYMYSDLFGKNNQIKTRPDRQVFACITK